MLFASLKHQITIFLIYIVGLIPLILMITHESCFKIPILFIQRAILVKLLLSYNLIVRPIT